MLPKQAEIGRTHSQHRPSVECCLAPDAVLSTLYLREHPHQLPTALPHRQGNLRGGDPAQVWQHVASQRARPGAPAATSFPPDPKCPLLPHMPTTSHFQHLEAPLRYSQVF